MAKKKQATEKSWKIVSGDCVENIPKHIEPGTVDLAILDPPYNIGRTGYDLYDDCRPMNEYLDWARSWLVQVHAALHKHGSMWLAIYPNLVSELDVICKSEFGLHKRGHIIWAFTFGVNNPKGFTRAHVHWLYYTRAKTQFTFNADAPTLRHPSARQLVYNDKRANPKGRLPDDVWVLRASELEPVFNGNSDVWLASRICGTFNDRVKGSDNQLPRAIIDRIVLACSNPGDYVLDPFAGTGTTLESAYQMGRRSIGFELSETYCKNIEARMAKPFLD